MGPLEHTGPADCREDAEALLRLNGMLPDRIVDVHIDAILWIDRYGRPRTSFVEVSDVNGRLQTRVTTRARFPIDP